MSFHRKNAINLLLIAVTVTTLLGIAGVYAQEDESAVVINFNAFNANVMKSMTAYKGMFMYLFLGGTVGGSGIIGTRLNTDHEVIQTLGKIIFSLLIPLWMLVIMLTAIYYIWGAISPNIRAKVKTQLTKLIVGIIACGVAFPLYDLLLGMNNTVVDAILTSGGVPSDWGPFTGFFADASAGSTLGGGILGLIVLMTGGSITALIAPIICMIAVLIMMPYFMLVIRWNLVLVFGALFPFTIFCQSFDFLKGMGTKLMKQTLTWIFMPVPMSIFVVLSYNLGKEATVFNVAPAMAAFSAYILIGLAPAMITSMLTVFGSGVVLAGKTLGNTKTVFIGNVIMGSGGSSFTEAAFHSNLMEGARKQDRMDSAQGMLKDLGYGIPDDANKSQPAPPTTSSAWGSSKKGGVGGAGTQSGAPAPDYVGERQTGSGGGGPSGVDEKGISGKERGKRAAFGRPVEKGKGEDEMSTNQYWGVKFENSKTKLGKTGAVAMGIISNFSARKLLVPAGMLLRGMIRQTISGTPLGKSLTRLSYRMTGYWERDKVTGQPKFNYAWQSNKGILRDIAQSTSAMYDAHKGKGLPVGMQLAAKTLLRGLPLAIFMTPIIPAAGIGLAIGAAGVMIAARGFKAAGDRINDKERVNDVKSGETPDKLWDKMSSRQRQQFGHKPGETASDDMKQSAHTHYKSKLSDDDQRISEVNSHKNPDEVWTAMTDNQKSQFGWTPGSVGTPKMKENAHAHYNSMAKKDSQESFDSVNSANGNKGLFYGTQGTDKELLEKIESKPADAEAADRMSSQETAQARGRYQAAKDNWTVMDAPERKNYTAKARAQLGEHASQRDISDRAIGLAYRDRRDHEWAWAGATTSERGSYLNQARTEMGAKATKEQTAKRAKKIAYDHKVEEMLDPQSGIVGSAEFQVARDRLWIDGSKHNTGVDWDANFNGLTVNQKAKYAKAATNGAKKDASQLTKPERDRAVTAYALDNGVDINATEEYAKSLKFNAYGTDPDKPWENHTEQQIPTAARALAETYSNEEWNEKSRDSAQELFGPGKPKESELNDTQRSLLNDSTNNANPQEERDQAFQKFHDSLSQDQKSAIGERTTEEAFKANEVTFKATGVAVKDEKEKGRVAFANDTARDNVAQHAIERDKHKPEKTQEEKTAEMRKSAEKEYSEKFEKLKPEQQNRYALAVSQGEIQDASKMSQEQRRQAVNEFALDNGVDFEKVGQKKPSMWKPIGKGAAITGGVGYGATLIASGATILTAPVTLPAAAAVLGVGALAGLSISLMRRAKMPKPARKKILAEGEKEGIGKSKTRSRVIRSTAVGGPAGAIVGGVISAVKEHQARVRGKEPGTYEYGKRKTDMREKLDADSMITRQTSPYADLVTGKHHDTLVSPQSRKTYTVAEDGVYESEWKGQNQPSHLEKKKKLEGPESAAVMEKITGMDATPPAQQQEPISDESWSKIISDPDIEPGIEKVEKLQGSRDAAEARDDNITTRIGQQEIKKFMEGDSKNLNVTAGKGTRLSRKIWKKLEDSEKKSIHKDRALEYVLDRRRRERKP